MGSFNKGEWSELYAFMKLLSDGRIYAADEDVNRLEDIYFPIIKLIREEIKNETFEYYPGERIRIYKDEELVDELDGDTLEKQIGIMYKRIFAGARGSASGAFEIQEANEIMDRMYITKVKASSAEKVDLTMQIHDINTGYSPIVGFSVKSDMGNPPTLLNAGKNTRFIYEIYGIDDQDMKEINAIDKSVTNEYMIVRMGELFSKNVDVRYFGMKDTTYEDNLIMIDSKLPDIYGEMILNHFKHLKEKISDCEALCQILGEQNIFRYRRKDVYRYKIKKLLCAAALGMTPGKEWKGLDIATGGYIIIKKDGDVLCYHIYNRNYFEEYLIKNTCFDRPSATRHDYGYIYKVDGKYYIDLNVQIRFKSISAVTKNNNKDKAGALINYTRKICL